jgi:hypothetical protein
MLLEKIVPEHGVMEDYEVEHQFPGVGKRTMMLNARKVFYEGNPQGRCSWALRTSRSGAAATPLRRRGWRDDRLSAPQGAIHPG